MKQHWYIVGMIAVFASIEVADRLEMSQPLAGNEKVASKAGDQIA